MGAVLRVQVSPKRDHLNRNKLQLREGALELVRNSSPLFQLGIER